MHALALNRSINIVSRRSIFNLRTKSTFAAASSASSDDIFEQARENAATFDNDMGYKQERLTVPHSVKVLVKPIRPCPPPYPSNTLKSVPNHIPRPPYARTGNVPHSSDFIIINNEEEINSLRNSARLARDVLDIACNSAKAGMTTNDINDIVHQAIIHAGAYPSPLNYANFPKSVCSSINEVICHGIPDERKMLKGDLASFDVSCFLEGFHGDNCGSVMIGDDDPNLTFASNTEEELFISGRRLIQAAQEALDAGISTCREGSCLTEVGAAIASVADAYGYSSVEKYRGHGVGRDFHCPPFVKHHRNDDYLTLKEGMVFTIEPMIVEARHDCVEWPSDGWTVVTTDYGRSAQFEHMVAITKDGAEILTLPTSAGEK